MQDQRVYLKVKVKSLAAEARIIRTEERRNKYFRSGLAEHRKTVVRSAARHALLAYGFLRGRKYEEIERTAQTPPNWDRVKKMVKKYGTNYLPEENLREYHKRQEETLLRFEQWKPGKNLRQKAKHWALSKVV